MHAKSLKIKKNGNLNTCKQ